MRRAIFIAAAGIGSLAPLLGCGTPVGPAPIVPSAHLEDACTNTAYGKVRYTYTVFGTGWWWSRTASSTGIVEYLHSGATLQFYARGETWVMFADDLDDDRLPAIEAAGGHQPPIWPANKECA